MIVELIFIKYKIPNGHVLNKVSLVENVTLTPKGVN